MAVSNKESWLYTHATLDCKVGNGLKSNGTFGQATLSTAKTEVPLGISVESVTFKAAAPYNSVSVETMTGAQVKMVAGAAIGIDLIVTSTTNGNFIAAAKALDSATANWAWGRAIEAAGALNDVFSGIFNWFEMQIA